MIEWHNLCDNCGELLVASSMPAPYATTYCPWCSTLWFDGVSGEWREWDTSKGTDWAGCA